MEWSREAEELLGRVPFFVRKKVRKKVEEEAGRAGRQRVTPRDVRRARERYLARMEEEVRGHRLETCFGEGGCPNRAVESVRLVERLERILSEADLLGFLKQEVGGPLRHHHEFRVALADCPNGCSRPQIQGIGLIGAREPGRSDDPCTACNGCVEICKENAIALETDPTGPFIDPDACLGCGACIEACPSGTLVERRRGWRVLLGGKLGRHPRLAEELPGLYTEDEVVDLVKKAVAVYEDQARGGERFSDLYDRLGKDAFHP
jgi:dissimilatory sulfite reductase (desulfoviridin) alpha/beta subunit